MEKIKHLDTVALVKSEQKKVTKQTKRIKKKIEAGDISVKPVKKTKKRGLVFLSHIPHGFYENEMKSFFLQFGKVTNVKVCRSSRSGRSKGYAYVEFAYADVAKIVAETMNNYLMFKKRLVAEYVPAERRPPFLFRTKPSEIPSTALKRQRQRQADSNLTEGKHNHRVTRRLARLNKKIKKLNSFGIQTDFLPVDVKDIKQEKTSEPSIEQKKKSNSEPEVAESSSSPKKFTSSKKQKSKEKKGGKGKKEGKEREGVKKTALKKKLAKSGAKTPPHADTIKRIAKQLIGEKGASVLVFPKPQKTSKKKTNKK